jgi:Uma2 family endonuclease
MANGALRKEAEHFTYADYKDWDLAAGERFELIHGTAYAMAGPGAYHQSILGELFKQIAVYLTGKSCKVYPAPYDVRLFYRADENDDTVVQPDITVVCDEKKRGPEGCRGAPDFTAEILSPSNTAIEMERKFELYRQAGVREYWVLDPEQKTLRAYRFNAAGKAGEADAPILTRSYGPGDTAVLEVLDNLEIALGPVFAG